MKLGIVEWKEKLEEQNDDSVAYSSSKNGFNVTIAQKNRVERNTGI